MPASLRFRIMMVIGLVSAGCTAIPVALITARHAQEATEDRAGQALKSEAHLSLLRVQDSFAAPRGEVEMLSRTPPIPGLIRAAAANGLDIRENVPATLWEERLAAIFTAVMRVRAAYFQIRLVSLDEQGREIVRVDRRGDDIVTVPRAELQTKASEPYFEDAALLGPGEVAIGPVTFNREKGRRDPRNIRAVRIYTPVFAPDGTPFAFVVVNVDYHAILRDAALRLELPHDLLLYNDAGDFLTTSRERGGRGLRIGHVETADSVPEELTLLRRHPDDGLVEADGRLFGLETHRPASPSDPPPLHAAVWLDRDVLLAPTRAAMGEGALVSLAVAAAASVLGGLLAGRLTRSLRDMTQQISDYGIRGRALRLPTAQQDEVGDLARAFDSLMLRLRESETKAQAVLDDLLDAVVVIDEEGRIEEFSRAAERMFGYSEQEALGRNVDILMPQAERPGHRGAIARYVETGRRRMIGGRTEQVAARRDGAPFPADIAVSEIRLGGRRLFCAVIRDASEREKRRRATEFISTVNHELRTPLTTIQASLGMLRDTCADALDARGARLVELASSGAGKLARIVDDIIDIEKMEEGKLEFRLEVADLNALTQEQAERWAGAAEDRDVRIVVTPCATPCPVAVDPLRFGQALGNLVSNALRFSPAGAAVAVRVRRTGPRGARVTVQDQGPGVPEAFRDRIFERFAQAEGAQSGGSGLGLNIARGLIRAFGGELGFESREGAGAAFHIDLPLHSRQGERAEAAHDGAA